MNRFMPLLILMLLFGTAEIGAGDPLSLNLQNPHYFEYEHKATVLVTSGEHYGAVINQDFDYVRYLDELARNHLNLTRVWSGAYREVPGDFQIGNNTLAPRPERFISPWQRSNEPGAYDGGNRFDLARWNPAYFARLHDFLKQASRRNIVVEINLFCVFYQESMWKASPLNAGNNINGIGDVARSEVLSTEHPNLLRIEDELVRKIVTEVNSFDNVYFEICNEPYEGHVSFEWQEHVADIIVQTERHLPQRHLISRNVANGWEKVEHPDRNVSILNFHYARPPRSVEVNYDLDKAIGYNETGFDGQSDDTYRIQGWAFLTAGGTLYNNLDYSFTVGHENGNGGISKGTPGGGGPELRRQLGILATFFRSLPLASLRPANALVMLKPSVSDRQDSTRLCALAAPGEAYVVYLYRAKVNQARGSHFEVDQHLGTSRVSLNLPAGTYQALWLRPRTGAILGAVRFQQNDRTHTLTSPAYSEDLVLYVRTRKARHLERQSR